MNWFKKKEQVTEEKYYNALSSFLEKQMPPKKDVSSRIDAAFAKKAAKEKLRIPTAKAMRLRLTALFGAGFALLTVFLVSVWMFRPDLYLPVIRLIATPQVAAVQMQGIQFTEYGVDPNVPSFALQVGKEMNERFIASAVKITPVVELTTELSPDKKNIIVTPKEHLQEGTVYELELKPGIVFQDGSYLASGQSWVIPVRSKFAVTGITPAGGSIAPFTTAIEVLVNRDNISVEAFQSAFSIAPSVSGKIEKRNGMFVFIPEKQLMANGTYTVTVAQSLTSESGETLSQGAESTFSVAQNIQNPDGTAVAYQGPKLHFPVKVQNMNQNQVSVVEASGMSRIVMTFYKVSSDRIQGIMEQYAKEGQVNWGLFTKDAEVARTYTATPSSGAHAYTANELGLGMYIVKAASQDGGYAAYQVILKSGVGSYVVAEQNADKTGVWVMDYGVFGTVNGADVSAYSCGTNGCAQVSSVTTAENGFAQLKAIGRNGYILTKYKDGVSLVAVGELSQYVGSYDISAGTASALFGDIQLSKPFYAPGEVVRYTAYIRERKGGDTLPPSNASLRAVVCGTQSSTSRNDFSQNCSISPIGMSADGQITGEFSALGRGIMRFAIVEEPQSGVFRTVTEEWITVMTAENPRFVITGSLNQNTYLAGEEIILTGRVTDYAGNGIANQTLAVSAWLSPMTIDPLSSGTVSIEKVQYATNGNSFSTGNVQVRTDNSGNYRTVISVQAKDITNFLYKASVSISMQQGEVSTGITKDVLIGNKQAYKVFSQQEGKDIAIARKSVPATVRIQAATLFSGSIPEGHRATVSAVRKWSEKVENGRVYNPVTKQTETRYRYEQRSETVLAAKTAIFSDKGEFAFELKDLKDGTYSVTITDAEGKIGTFDVFYVTAPYDATGATEKITSFGFSTTYAKPGEKISLLLAHTFKDSKRKMVLLTMTDTITDWKFIDASADTIPFEVTREMIGGVKVCLVYPMQVVEQNGNNLEALGGAIDDAQCSYLPVEDPDQKLSIAIYSDKTNYEPGKEANVFVEVRDQSGKPVSGTVGITVVDSALRGALSVPEFWEDDTYETFYRQLRSNFPLGKSSINFASVISKGYGDFGGRGSGGEGSEAVRKNFSDNPFWAATVNTDNEGKAKVSFTLPDGITQWTVKAWAMTPKTQTGVTYATFVTSKETYVSFEAPPYVRQGDAWNPVITVVNTSEKAFSGSMTASCAGCMEIPSIVSVSVPAKSSAQFSVPVVFKSVSPAVLDIQLKRGDSVVDAIAKTITVRPIDVTAQQTTIFRLSGENQSATLQLPDSLVSEQTTATITLNKYPFSASDLLTDPEVETTEGIAGALLAAITVMEQKDARNEGISDAYIQQRVVHLLQTLLSRQQSNGGFGQFSYDTTTLKTSSYAALAIARAQNMSALKEKLPDSARNKLSSYILGQIRSGTQPQADIMWGLYGLAALDKTTASPLVTNTYFTRADRKLTNDDVAVLAIALQTIGSQADAMVLSVELMSKAENISNTASLVPFNTPTVSQSMLVSIMANSVLSPSQKEQLAKLQQWVMVEDRGVASHTFDFYISRLLLLGSFENTIFNSVPFRAEVLVNGSKIGEVSYKGGEEQMTVPGGMLKPGTNEITAKLAFGKQLFISVQTNTVTTGDITEAPGTVSIKREVINLSRSGNVFKIGDAGYVKLTLTPREQVSQLQIREYIPSGIVPAGYRTDMSKFWQEVHNQNAVVLFGDIRMQDYVGASIPVKAEQNSIVVMYPFVAARKGTWKSGVTWIIPGASSATPTIVKVPQIVVE
ncbi:MAG: alpha-2-macroglobulin family protein [Candidatus Dojkabacteria bacterium]|nr:MAG: alpha-2-macroglobulin family protein [Candidatus Dojkabacteria bacterium]